MKQYLSFSLSLLQEFNGAMRTTRDVWTGSYLLSWLTAHTMATVFKSDVQIDSSNIKLNSIEESPLTERNNSILDHGQSPISQKGYQLLCLAIEKLVVLGREKLPQFPKLEH